MWIQLTQQNRAFLRKVAPMACVLALGSFQVGYIFSSMSFVFYVVFFKELVPYNNWLPVFSTLFLFGNGFGSLLSICFVNKCGRKKTILLSHLLLIPGVFLLNIKVYPVSIVVSFIQGIFTGILSTLSPLMLYEISKVQVRGIIVAFHQVIVCSGIFIQCFLAFCALNYSGIKIAAQADTDPTFQIAWRVVVSLPSVFGAIIAIVIVFKVPEKQPVELLQQDKFFQFRRLTQKIGHSKYSSHELQDELKYQEIQNLFHPTLFRSLILCIFLSFVEIVSSYYALLLYGIKLIYIDIDINNPFNFQDSFYKINFQTGVNFLSAILLQIFLVDRISRKINLLGGLLAIFPTLIFLFFFIRFRNEIGIDSKLINWEIAFVCCVACFYQLSIGSINRVIFTEVLPRRHFAIVNSANWTFAGVVALSTGYVSQSDGYLFLGYAVLLIIMFVITSYLLVDTLALPRHTMFKKINGKLESSEKMFLTGDLADIDESGRTVFSEELGAKNQSF